MHGRRGCGLDRLSQGPKAHHRKRCSRRRPQVRPERRESRRFFLHAHRSEIRNPALSALVGQLPRAGKSIRVSCFEFRVYDERMSGLLEVRGLTVELPTASGWVRPVNEVSLRIAAGESLGLVGESGSGKTMLSLALMGLLPPGARGIGEGLLATETSTKKLTALTDREWRDLRGGEIAMDFQEPMASLNPVMRIGAQIEETIRAHQPKLSAKEVKRKAVDSLRRAAVPEPEARAEQFPHQLSGGLRQRAMIAMALPAGPRLLIADGPTTALDVTVQKQILDLLDRLRRELQLGLLFITHDLGVVAQVAARVAVAYPGLIVDQGPPAGALRAPRHPYTPTLLAPSPSLQQTQLTP